MKSLSDNLSEEVDTKLLNVNGNTTLVGLLNVTGDTILTGTLNVAGNVGIGTTSPTAALHIKAGSATAGTAPLKFTSGSLLSTPELGAVEYNKAGYYGTVSLAVGDVYGGGIIAYILQAGDPGYEAGKTKGLIAAVSDVGSAFWCNGYNQYVPLAEGTAIGTGMQNTEAIIATANCSVGSSQAIAQSYRGGGYSDWYLPSKDELNTLYINRELIGNNFTTAYRYLSSSEYPVSSTRYWAQVFIDGSIQIPWKDSQGGGIRPIRSFSVSSSETTTQKQFAFTSDVSSLYVPYVGSTSNVDLGIHNLTVDTNSLFVDSVNHRVGLGTLTPTNAFSFDGTTSHTIWMERNTTAATAGQGLTLSSGGAIAGTNNLAGGDLNLKSGISTGTGTSALHFFTATAGSSGATDNTPTEKMTILGNGSVGIGLTTPTALLHIKAGSATANTAPLKFTSGTNLTTAEAGAMEYDGTQLYFSPSSTRNIVGQVSGSTALTTGSIPFATTSGYLTQDNANLFWDVTNHRLGIGTTAPVGKLQLGNLTSNGSSSYMVIGHNGTTSGSSNGTSTIRFASQYSNYPYTLGAEGNGYDFYLRQASSNQGSIFMDFSSTGTLAFAKADTGATTPITVYSTVNSMFGSNSNDRYTAILNPLTSLSTSSASDSVYLARYLGANGYVRTSDPVVTVRNGLPTTASDNLVGNKAYWYRNGYIGIGTANTDGNTTNPLSGALTINQGTLTGYQNSSPATSSKVLTSGSSTTVTFTPDNGNTNVTYGIVVGSQITANSVVRTVTQVNKASVVVDSAIDWSNGGSGYTFTYRNPYVSIKDSTTSIFNIDPNGSVGIGLTAPTALLHIKAGSATANTAPLKFTSGTNLTTAEAGAMEYDGTQLYFSPSTTRNIVGQISGSTALTTGSIPFATTSGYLTQDNANLFWDNTNKRLGVGTTSPSAALDVHGATTNDSAFSFQAANSGGTALLAVRNDGNVGIGTTTPEYKLDVNGAINATSMLINGVAVGAGGTQWASGGGGGLSYSGGFIGIGTATPTNILSLGNGAAQKFWIENTATDVVGRALTVAAGSTVAGTSTSNIVGGQLILQSGLGTGTGDSSIAFQTGTTLTTGTTLQTMSTKMSILGNGNVGIGTTVPSGALDVHGSTSDSTAFSFQAANSGGTALLAVRNDGNVGIGTTEPGSKLHILQSGSGTGYTPISNALLVLDDTGGNINSLQFLNTSSYAGEAGILWGDANTNAAGRIVYKHSDNHMGFYTNGTEKVRIDTSGNVGIGTTVPLAPLNVMANNVSYKAQQWGYVGSNDTYNLQLNDVVTAGNVAWSFDTLNNSTLYSNTLVINKGNVGIGTTSPANTLDINGGINSNQNSQLAMGNGKLLYVGSGIYMGLTGTTFKTVNYNNDFDYSIQTRTGGNYYDRLYVKGTSGNVGIGTTTPGDKLHIAGGNVILGPVSTTAGTTGALQFRELAANGTEFVGLKAPDAITTSVTYTLPSADGSINQVLQTNGSGVLSWTANSAASGMSNPFTTTGDMVYASNTATPATVARLNIGMNGQCLVVTLGLPAWGACPTAAGLVPAGNTTEVQFNNGGSFGTSPNFTYDNTNFTLSSVGVVAGAKVSMALLNSSTGDTATNSLHIGNDTAADTLDLWVNSSANTSGANSAYIYNRQNAPLTLGTNNTAAMTILANGNVGVGTTAPAAPLSIGSTTNSSVLMGTTNSAVNAVITLGQSSISATNWNIKVTNGTALELNGVGGYPVYIGNSGVANFYSYNNALTFAGAASGGQQNKSINMDRNQLAGGLGSVLTISSGGVKAGETDLSGGDLNLKSGISTGTGSSTLRFFTSTPSTTGTTDNTPTEKMTILGNGNVGIGTTSPGAALHIHPSLAGTSGIIVQGNPSNDANLITAQYNNGSLVFQVDNNGYVRSMRGLFGTNMTNNINLTSILPGVVTMYDASGNVANVFSNSGNSYFKNGSVGIGTTSPAQQLELTASMRLPTTTSSTTGVIYKGTNRFIHNFNATGTTGNNTWVGINAGNFTLTGSGGGNQGSNNTAVGQGAMPNITTGMLNTGIGSGVLDNNSSGNYNAAMGYQALGRISTGAYNTAIGGNQAGYFYANGSGSNTTGSKSIFIGSNTRPLNNGDTNEIVIGDSTDGLGSNTVVLGNSSIFKTILAGSVGIGTTTPSYKLQANDNIANYVGAFINDGNSADHSGILIQSGLDDNSAVGPSTLIGFNDGDGTSIGSITFGSNTVAYNTTSDERLKTLVNAQTLSSLNVLNQIAIHDFTWNNDTSNDIYTGVFAQELYTIYPHAVTKPIKASDNWMVDYSKLTPVIIASIQELDLKLENVNNLDIPNTWRDSITAWLANGANKITRIFTGEICLTEAGQGAECINRSELKQLKALINAPVVPSAPVTPVVPAVTPATPVTPVVPVVPAAPVTPVVPITPIVPVVPVAPVVPEAPAAPAPVVQAAATVVTPAE